MDHAPEKVQTFEDILYMIGDNGRFQKRYTLLYVAAISFLVTMPYLNMIIAMLVPDHWCHVPGRNLTNLTVEEWKSVTLPLKNNMSGEVVFSSCTMYNISNLDISNIQNMDRELEIVDCQHGWDYNRDWFSQSIPTEKDWVCEKEMRVTNTFTILRIGELCGGMLSGLFTDAIGRKPTYYASVLAVTLGRLGTLVTTSNYALFLLTALISCTSTTSMYQSPLITALEIASPEQRARISVFQQVAFSLGNGILPCAMWISGGEWSTFLLVTTLPALIFFLITARNAIESPRWLLNNGKIEKCIEELYKIAKSNKTQLPSSIHRSLSNLPRNTEKSLSFLSLFSHWRIAKNTLCSAFCFGAFQVSYYIIFLNVGKLGGDPLLNLIFLGLIEVPGYILSKMSVDFFGRRCSHVAGFMVTALACFFLIAIIKDPNYKWLVTVISVFLKLTLSFGFYAINLTSCEINPTCLRQTGLSVCTISANVFAILGPYIVLLGTSTDDRLVYVILSLFTFAAALCGLSLPETLHQNLPDTIAEAQKFGKEQSFWSFPCCRRSKFEAVKTSS